jgi:methylamine dehydrogenase accessory protein MauD
MASYVGLWVIVLLLTVAVVALGRQIGLLHYRLPPSVARMGAPGPKVGERLDPLEENDLAGRPVTLGSERGKQTLLVFMSSGCESCEEVAPAVRSIARSEQAVTDTIVVTRESGDSFDAGFFARHKLDELPVVSSQDLADELGVLTTPYALLVDQQGILRTKGIVNNLDQLVSLFNALDTGYPSMDAYMAAQAPESSHEKNAVAAQA